MQAHQDTGVYNLCILTDIQAEKRPRQVIIKVNSKIILVETIHHHDDLSQESSRRDGCNEGSEHMFLEEINNKKKT